MKINVLIVEDELPLARGLAMMIERMHPSFCVIDICKNGKQGVASFQKNKPELVFVDINMPMMNGLEMISAIMEMDLRVRFVILTGYAKFEFAQKALKMGVTDYLLKPVAPNELEGILNTFYTEYKERLIQEQKAYVLHCLAIGQTVNRQYTGDPFTCFLLLINQGIVPGSEYDYRGANPSDSPTEVLFREPDINAFTAGSAVMFPAGFINRNTHVYAVITVDRAYDRFGLANRILQWCSDRQFFVNISVSKMSASGEFLLSYLQSAYNAGRHTGVFGIPQVCSAEDAVSDTIYLTDEIIPLCSVFSGHLTTEKDVKNAVATVISCWSKKSVTYAQLEMDLKYILGQVARECGGKSVSIPDTGRLIADCCSYSSLSSRLCMEICQMCGIDRESKDIYGRSLAEQVKKWIECNFTRSFTYKMFPDLFGYSEKYISHIYKEVYGITPNKYAEMLRISTAKKIIRENPDILISETAKMTGFSDQFYFSRVFKQNEKISPSEYAKMVRDNAGD